ncbi:MAG: hypothetical protein IJ644_03510 [Oscillospiraceae bacterium]|nr:hypothetical protein [Oscillospiraceae bacterium]
MPFINVKTNQAVSKAQQETIKAGLGKAIATLPGKSEQWLMVGIEPEHILYHQGTDAPAAMVEVQIHGTAPSSAYSKLTGEISEILNSELAIPKNRIYVSYTGTPDWGWNGSNF